MVALDHLGNVYSTDSSSQDDSKGCSHQTTLLGMDPDLRWTSYSLPRYHYRPKCRSVLRLRSVPCRSEGFLLCIDRGDCDDWECMGQD